MAANLIQLIKQYKHNLVLPEYVFFRAHHTSDTKSKEVCQRMNTNGGV